MYIPIVYPTLLQECACEPRRLYVSLYSKPEATLISITNKISMNEYSNARCYAQLSTIKP